jgi:hypothetical protein
MSGRAAMRSRKNGGRSLSASVLLLLLACICVNELDAFMHQPHFPVFRGTLMSCSGPTTPP